MAFSESYTVVIIPLQSSLHSLDALRFFLWLKRLKDLEKEKDCLWAGLQVLEQARLWYQCRLEENRHKQGSAGEAPWAQESPARRCFLRICMQRVNGSLGDLVCDPAAAAVPYAERSRDPLSNLRWRNTALVQEVSARSLRISRLEQERDSLLQQLGEL
ncbi:suppressor APC domain-containing protein 1 [Megalops cyprinoides]|uniref:suppressor APC domain-containing protein 1 n=1 Tax=Megalops cyprinoides TaxID=118141 RepID=UPI001864CF0A|nr:suppressor APC domain-containing protein 1 [Megalops cyprinoides]